LKGFRNDLSRQFGRTTETKTNINQHGENAILTLDVTNEDA
jgi:hypothetical protein